MQGPTTGQDKFQKIIEKYPHPYRTFSNRPFFTRRKFFEVVGAGVTGSYLIGRAPAAVNITSQSVTTRNTAKNVIFILLAGAPSHVDTFDFKMVDGVTPAAAKPEMVNGILWPTGILPKLKNNLPDFALVRSMRAWALVHGLAQTWTQIGRNPAAALGDIAPNIGSIVAIEKTAERLPTHVFPTFIGLNSSSAAGPGYLASSYAPFQASPSSTGLPDTTNVDGQPRIEERWSLLHSIDDPLRVNSPLGKAAGDMDDFYTAAKGLMYNTSVQQAFGFTAADSMRFGNNGFGNACLVAKQILAANQGTRFIQITVGGWDMHQNIYGMNGNPAQGTNIFTLGKVLDDGVSALIGDLKASGLFKDTLIVMAGEFGRTVGKLTAANGRDHFPQQFAFFAGGGIKGGQVIGSTTADGSATVDPGWAGTSATGPRDVKPEDIEATIYSAMGINWTTVRYDDPFGRGFEYVPHSDQDLYGPIDALWGS
jgi:hypothetical protein